MKEGTSVLTDEQIVESWSRNSAPWAAAVRAREIASRALVTDAAIVDSGLRMTSLREPVHPETGKPVSLILMGQLP